MRALPVVEDLDVFEDVDVRSGSCFERTIAHELLLQRREEALSDGVVPAAPRANN